MEREQGPQGACITPMESFRNRQWRMQWNDTASDYPRDCSVHKLFEWQAAQTPYAIAVADGADQITYEQLNARANHLANYLVKFLTGPEPLVAIAMDRSLPMIVSMLGVLKAGGAYLPLDPNYPAERLKFMLEDARPELLITNGPRRNIGSFGGIRVIPLDEQAGEINQASPANPETHTPAENLAYVMYTSGSTGIPKGAQILHRGIVRLVRNTNYVSFAPGDAVAQIANPSFDAITFEVWGALLNGGRLVILPTDVILSPARFAAAIQEQRISIMFLTAPLFRVMASMAPDAFGTMKTLVVGGDAVDPEAARKVLRTAPPRALVNGYGPTEATTFSVCHLIADVPSAATSIPIGKPISNSEAYIVDEELQEVEIGEPGELCLAGDGIARGYLNRPDLNAEKFVPNPFNRGRSPLLYRTGDLARYRPDGVIEFLGRADRQVKLRGFRVELGEVEAALRRHPGVVDCAVVRVKDSLVAYAVTTREMRLAGAELRRFLSAKLPDFMIPASVTILDALPLTPSGKLDRNALASASTTVQGRSEFVTELQDSLCDIWRKVCGIESPSLDESFFDLGGSSLHLAEIESEVRSRLGADVTITDLFAYPTIRSLSRRLENGAATPARFEDARDRALKQGQAFQNMRPVRQAAAAAGGTARTGVPRVETN